MTNTIRHTVFWPRVPWRKDTYSFMNLKPKITTLKTNHLWRARGSSPNENSVNRKKCKIIKLWWRNTKLLTNCSILCCCPQLLSSVWLFQTWLPGSFADCSLPSFSVHGILQARILEWVAVPFSRVSTGWFNWTGPGQEVIGIQLSSLSLMLLDKSFYL